MVVCKAISAFFMAYRIREEQIIKGAYHDALVQLLESQGAPIEMAPGEMIFGEMFEGGSAAPGFSDFGNKIFTS